MDSNPAAILRRAAKEPEAFGAFYRVHVSALFAYLVRRVHDADVAMDLTAETFAQAFVSRKRFRGHTEGEAAAWLYRIGERQLGRYFRRRTVELRALKKLGIASPALDEDQRNRIDDYLSSAAIRAQVQEELKRLSTAQQLAVRLRVVEELSYAEVASHLGISEEAARARVMRGLKSLANRMKQQSMQGGVGI